MGFARTGLSYFKQNSKKYEHNQYLQNNEAYQNLSRRPLQILFHVIVKRKTDVFENLYFEKTQQGNLYNSRTAVN